MIEKHNITDRASWLLMRMQDITASDVAACSGVSPWKTPLKLFHQKLGNIPPTDETAAMRRGIWLEPSALFAIREQQPTWDIRKPALYLRDPELRIGCTPDLVAIDPARDGFGVIQVKTVALRIFREKWLQEDETIVVPLDYSLQTITEAKMTGSDWAMLAVLVTGEFSLDLHIIEVPINDGAWKRIVADVRQMWWHIDNLQPPSIQPYEDNETLRELYPEEDAEQLETIDLSYDNQLPSLLAERAAAMKAIKANDYRKTEIETHVMALLKDKPAGTLPGWGVTWRTQQQAAYTVAARETRVLRISERKQK